VVGTVCELQVNKVVKQHLPVALKASLGSISVEIDAVANSSRLSTHTGTNTAITQCSDDTAYNCKHANY
jgi:hypothetical protein